MLETRVIPCLLLQEDLLVKTVKFKNPVYVGDPVNAIKIYNEKEVDELVVLDIQATAKKQPVNFELLQKITEECFMPLAYGGGVRSLEDMARLFKLGIEKIILNSYALENPQFISEAAAKFGGQSIVVSVDVKKNLFSGYEIWNQSKGHKEKMSLIDFVKKAETLGAGEILLTSVDRDGTWEGYDLEMIQKVTSETRIPVIASGGAGKIEDFSAAVQAGASAVAIGSMAVFQKKNAGVLINFPKRADILKVLSHANL